MITTSNSPAKGSGIPNHYAGDLLHTMAISGFSRVRTELFKLTVIPAMTPHPVQMHRQLSGHRYLRDLSSSAQGQVVRVNGQPTTITCTVPGVGTFTPGSSCEDGTHTQPVSAGDLVTIQATTSVSTIIQGTQVSLEKQ